MNKDIKLAQKAREFAYAPYTKYTVGCVLKTKSGKTYTGCNIENFGVLSICAERTAFVKAISEGEKDFESITIVGAKAGKEPTKECLPCGYCRQFMKEFVDKDFKIISIDDGKAKEYTLNDLLPHSFSL